MEKWRQRGLKRFAQCLTACHWPRWEQKSVLLTQCSTLSTEINFLACFVFVCTSLTFEDPNHSWGSTMLITGRHSPCPKEIKITLRSRGNKVCRRGRGKVTVISLLHRLLMCTTWWFRNFSSYHLHLLLKNLSLVGRFLIDKVCLTERL